MPKGKAPIYGAVGWPLKLPESVCDPQEFLDWRDTDLPDPSRDELCRLCEQVRVALGRYLGFRRSTPQLTMTERRRLLRKAKRGELDPLALDVNTRAAHYKGREPRGRHWPDPLLFDLVIELAKLWEIGTGKSARTQLPIGKFPFGDWVAELLEASEKGKRLAPLHTIRDILDTRPKKSRL